MLYYKIVKLSNNVNLFYWTNKANWKGYWVTNKKYARANRIIKLKRPLR